MPKVIGGSLAALREQLYERGFESVTLSGIAADAGVGRTSIYNHFPDRQSLLVAFVEHEAARYVTDLDAALEAAGSPTDRLAVFARMQLHRLAGFHLPPGPALAGARDPTAYRRLAAHADPIPGRLGAIVADGVAAGEMAGGEPDVLVAMVSAALSARRIVDVAPDALPASIESAVRVVLRMVSSKPRTG